MGERRGWDGREGKGGEGGREGEEGEGRGGERGEDVEGPGKWSAPGPVLALGGPGPTGGDTVRKIVYNNIYGKVYLCPL